jgi:hypothetical protein
MVASLLRDPPFLIWIAKATGARHRGSPGNALRGR